MKNNMNIHLIKSSEVAPELFTQVIDLLHAINGPMKFFYDPDSIVDFDEDELFIKVTTSRRVFEKKQSKAKFTNNCIDFMREFPMKRPTASWKTLFNSCATYRRKKEIPIDEFVLFLTDIPNELNWFAALDERMPYNGFIHTADWDHYMDCSEAFPIAYEVIALVLQKHMFNGMASLRSAVHVSPVGCVNDMCIKKPDVILKMRTADICRSCMTQLKEKVPIEVIHHALGLMESLRGKMRYAQNFMQNSLPSTIVIDINNRIFLTGFSNIEIKLRPLEKALYFLFLRYPKGIYLTSLCDHRQELYDIYAGISNTGTLQNIRIRIDDMVNVLNNSANEKLSRIKRVFEESIGGELAKQYYIRGEAGEAKKIDFDRSLLTQMNR